MTEQGIRPYGPGKFDTIVDSYVYDLSLNGCDEETGEAETTGWYGRINGPFKLSEEPFDQVDLTWEEKHLISTTAGCIISEDSQGFVSVEYFDSAAELEGAWCAIEGFVEKAELGIDS